MVYRVYTEKKAAYSTTAARLLKDIRDFLGVHSVTSLRIVNRYDLEGLSETVFESTVANLLSE
ncbi:MAG: phosphoribosylformylglycinamidine synthase, partial [Oscillospiraceae bacterium]|nr:phosphoribosylformylglycinamidine synthase [Oscillospiraceae bacterium]